MGEPRSYGDPCGVARSLDVVGERWALLVVRELLLGPKRFSDLLGGLPGASPNVVSQRLRDLISHGVVVRRELGPPTRVHLYELSEWGYGLEPAIVHFGRWGSQAPRPDRGVLGIDSLVLSFKAAFDGSIAHDVTATYELHVDDHVFTLELAEGALHARRRSASSPDATITTTREALTAVVEGERTVADVLDVGALTVTGGQAASAVAVVSLLQRARRA